MAATTEPLLADDLVQLPSTPPPLQRTDMNSSQGQDQLVQTGTPRPSRSITPSYDQLGALLSTPQSNLNQVSVQHAVSPTTSRLNAAKDLPNPDDIDHAGIDQLRQMAKSLIKDLTEARISTANTKLQHNLLALETAQAAERAEVENQLTRRQVDHLRLQMRQRTPALKQSTSPAVAHPSQAQLDSLARTCKALEDDLNVAEEQQQRLQRMIDLKQEYIETLSETNAMLKARIIENRQHMTRFREQSPIFVTPREAYTTPRRKSYSRFTEDTPFAALIAADQILSQETASVPSTPTKTHHSRFKHGHTRNVHSLSSLHTPHSKGRPSTADGYSAASLGTFSAPGSQLVNESAVRERQDRDSTISISDVEDNDDDDVHQSQASSLATSMLRKNPGSHEQTRQLQDAEKSSNLLQTKLFGHVTKSKSSLGVKTKRSHDFEDISSKTKKIRAEEGVGLGIAS